MQAVGIRQALIAAATTLWLVAAHAASTAPVAAENGMVVTAQRLATRVGVDVLKDGGNAVDAAVAVGYALAVVYPAAGNLGGGGFMTIQLADGRKTFLDFREKAPLVREALKALIERESARRLARLGGSQPNFKAPPRRRPPLV